MDRVVTFVQANQRLTKKLSIDPDGSLKVEPYPLCREVTSIAASFSTLGEFYDGLVMMAQEGAALLKGNLLRPLSNESRAGACDTSAPTTWMVLDYDSDVGYASPAGLLRSIDPILADTDYIFQHSASAGIKSKAGVRGHIFVLLTEPTPAAALKEWLRKVNLTVPKLRDQLALNKAGTGLCWPLDITVADNSKLIYIAPPECGPGVVDPIKDERWVLVEGSARSYDVTKSPISRQRNQEQTMDIITTLRDAKGLPPKKLKFAVGALGSLLENPDACTVTGEKVTGKYIRFNLNHGDSWAYWTWTDDPTFVYDYKSDTYCRTEDLIPDWWQAYQNRDRGEARVHALRDPMAGSFWNVHTLNDRVIKIVPAKSKSICQDYMREQGYPAPRIIDTWDVEFNPTTSRRIDAQNKWLNTFDPPHYLSTNKPSGNKCPIISRIIQHVCVDAETHLQFINWLAYIYQTRKKTKTAWVFHGAQGTGKGALFNKVISPIFGRAHCISVTESDLASSYNGYLKNALFVLVDEGLSSGQRKQQKLEGKLRNLITEEEILIQEKYEVARTIKNYTNFILSTNEAFAIELGRTDRRYNVAPVQTVPIKLADEYDFIDGELEDFAAFLRDYVVDEHAVRTILNNDAHDALVELGKTHAERFFDAVKDGNLLPFLDFYYARPPLDKTLQHIEFQRIVDALRESSRRGVAHKLDLQKLLHLYNYMNRDSRNELSGIRLGQLLRHHGLDTKRGKRPAADRSEQNKSEFRTYIDVKFHWDPDFDDLAVNTTPEIPTNPSLAYISVGASERLQ